MGLKVSSYLENFQPVIMKFFSLFSFHFLWDSIYMYFGIIYIIFYIYLVSSLCDGQLIFSQSLSILIFHVSI